jgi:hypothetical protein
LVQKSIVFSRASKNNDQAAKEWRLEVAYRALLLLRTTVCNINYPTKKIAAYEIPELSGTELTFCQPNLEFLRHAEIPHSKQSNSFRVPQKMAHLLRESINSHEERLTHPLAPLQMMNLLAAVDAFQGAFYGMRKFLVREIVVAFSVTA